MTSEKGKKILYASTTQELFEAWGTAENIVLGPGDFEIDGLMEVKGGKRISLRGAREQVFTKAAPWARRIACTVLSMFVGGGLSWRTRALGLSVALLGSEWLHSASNERRRRTRRTRLVLSSGGATKLLVSSGGELSLEDVSVARISASGCLIRCCMNGKLLLRGCDAYGGGNGVECEGFLVADRCRFLHCARSGIVLAGGRIEATRCVFEENGRFGCELQGGDDALASECRFVSCGACISDREKWRPQASVRFEKCSIEGFAACLPGLSVICGDGDDEAPAAVVFDSCTIDRVNGAGIYVLGNKSNVRVLSCVVQDASMAGIEALRWAKVRVERSVVRRNAGGGVIVHRGAIGTLRSCDLSSNGGGGNCGVLDSATCDMRSCVISRATAVGIHVCRASAVVQDCTVDNSREAGIVLGGLDSRSCREEDLIRRKTGTTTTASSRKRHAPKAANRRDSTLPSSRLTITNSVVTGSGAGCIYVAPHYVNFRHCFNESFRRRRQSSHLSNSSGSEEEEYLSDSVDATVEHTVIAADCTFVDDRLAMRFESPANGCLAGNVYSAKMSGSLSAWRGTRRLSWRIERLLHLGAAPGSDAPFRVLEDPALRRIIVEFAAAA